MKRLLLKLFVFVGEKLEDRLLVGDEGCLWPVEFARVRLAEIEQKAQVKP